MCLYKPVVKVCFFLSMFLFVFGCGREIINDQFIRPYMDNPAYWQYKGEPVLLLGATDDDNLFQMNDLESHLDELVECGGNYIRNTMSFRDSGNVNPYREMDREKYDLEKWSEAFWEKFSNLLKWTNERDIIVQIEVWDRFDYSREYWQKNPFNPQNNVNYEYVDSLFEQEYPSHPSADRQPFFHTIPGMPMYHTGLGRIREHQERYIDKMLSYTLEYGNVLYCMNNETTSPVEWGNYWIDYIRAKAKEKGKQVHLTDMYDHFFRVSTCERCLDLIAQPEYYTFMDVSQINSRNFGQLHWDTLQRIMELRDQYTLRPVNNTKIYGGGESNWGSGTNQDGVERFCRNVIGGCASVRHHRPPSGNGLNEKAIASIRATRQVEEWVKFWNVAPAMELLGDREENECYLAANEGEEYVLYFPLGGEVTLDLADWEGAFDVKWISVSTGEPEKEDTISSGREVPIEVPDNAGWYVVLRRI
ncbi:DUF6298 domain-containing protein [Membranihabitans maritimus]|uniref:DUF6298 domain-containing protein n=1 Tax=Membranihabitans maritimus TaxID=2904244 RepID=UPI001F43F268|nr:DUF6298 domain-containing protein [Membranihabitans maritimus]